MISFFKKIYKPIAHTMQGGSVGVDIADHTIEVIELRRVRGQVIVANLGRSLIEKGVVEKGRIKDPKTLAQVIKDTLAKAKPEAITTDKIVFGVPESQIYTHLFFLTKKAFSDAVKNKTIDILIQKTIEQHVPIASDKILTSYKTYKQKDGMVHVFVIVTNKDVLIEWRDFLKTLKWTMLFLIPNRWQHFGVYFLSYQKIQFVL